MNSFLVKIVYQIVCGQGLHAAQFDEQLRFVTAAHLEEALQKAHGIGLQEEETFYNSSRQLVQWRFVNVTEIYPLAELSDGAEICSQIKETGDAASYQSFVHHKASLLLRRAEFFIPENVSCLGIND